MASTMNETPVSKRWARIGPGDPSWLRHVPREGLCLSTFLIVQKGESILLGRPRANNSWPEKGGYPLRPAAELEKNGSWLLPATHLLMEESPDHSARRIANQWAGVRGIPKFVTLQSHVRPSRRGKSRPRWRTGNNHWDICFVYELRTRKNPKLRPWWSEYRFFSRSEMGRLAFGRGHKDVLKAGGYL